MKATGWQFSLEVDSGMWGGEHERIARDVAEALAEETGENPHDGEGLRRAVGLLTYGLGFLQARAAELDAAYQHHKTEHVSRGLSLTEVLSLAYELVTELAAVELEPRGVYLVELSSEGSKHTLVRLAGEEPAAEPAEDAETEAPPAEDAPALELDATSP